MTTENGENSVMIATNEITLPVKHTESSDINENLLGELNKLEANIESSTEHDETTIASPTEPNSDISLSNLISVICLWC